MIRAVILCGFALGLSSSAFAETVWSAPKCGPEPFVPTVRAGSVAQYNDSVDRVTAYEKAARAYNACVSAQANREETSISAEASARISHIHTGSAAVQSRIASAFQRLSAQLVQSRKKLGTH